MNTTHSQKREMLPVVAAWSVHALTASGVVLAFMAFIAVERMQFRTALLWLGAALVVDGIDGPLARWAKVKERVPGIDGTALDLVVDYLTYVFVPTFMILRAGLVPPEYGIAVAAAILMSSLYTFARTDMKTEDNFFRGFPAVWNVVAFYLFMLQPARLTGVIVVAIFSILTFAPIHFVHPVRVKSFRPWLPIVTTIWSASSLALLIPVWDARWMPNFLAVSSVCAVALLAIGLLRTLRRPGVARVPV